MSSMRLRKSLVLIIICVLIVDSNTNKNWNIAAAAGGKDIQLIIVCTFGNAIWEVLVLLWCNYRPLDGLESKAYYLSGSKLQPSLVLYWFWMPKILIIRSTFPKQIFTINLIDFFISQSFDEFYECLGMIF